MFSLYVHDTRLSQKGIPMRGIVLWLIGIPLPAIILLYLLGIF
jgi:hypothetical protein